MSGRRQLVIKIPQEREFWQRNLKYKDPEAEAHRYANKMV